MKLIKQQIIFFFNKDKEDIKEEVNCFRKENSLWVCSCLSAHSELDPAALCMEKAAQSLQLIPLSCDLECDRADKGFIPLSCIPLQ